MRSGGCAGSGRALRLDPFGLPVRFSATDTTADGRLRDVELHRERVVLRRSVRGMRMALNMPIAAFDGISLSLLPREGGSADMLAVMLKHSDPSLTLPLFLTSQPYEALAEWRAWSEVLGMPRVLAKERSASVSMAFRAAAHRTATPATSPSERTEGTPAVYSSSRGFGRVTEATPVHRGEREIIARN